MKSTYSNNICCTALRLDGFVQASDELLNGDDLFGLKTSELNTTDIYFLA
jgi:hypothetical protein